MNRILFSLLLLNILGCTSQRSESIPKATGFQKAIIQHYGVPRTEKMYSKHVRDTFTIFSALPSSFNDTTSLPLIILLDANAYFEPLLAELNLGELTQGIPQVIVNGIGYRDFWSMDSLRDRDYTYPVAPPEDEFSVSGGADKFGKFLDEEFLPSVTNKFHVDPEKIILLGHSLGGYYVLYHFLSHERSRISGFVSASPALSYAHDYILHQKKQKANSPKALFISMGSLEHDPHEKRNSFTDLTHQLDSLEDSNLKFKALELGNFDHMEAAIPGMMKGIVFILRKE